ncbi:MAG: phosphotransferase [Gordonia sp. (in: high G+C Gram-positive bacteria)]|uniref:phosphotransferase n=1 Tax=Gordonia TaxID=2053 RepID=UPI003266A878
MTGDYRTGNFLFDEDSGAITAILDWEWAHLGDFHEDLGWMLQELYSTHQDGEDLICGLMPRDELIAAYETASGRTVNPRTLRWYEIYCAYKSYAITLATSVKAARDGANHQDVMLSWMAPVGYRFSTTLCDMILGEVAA